MTDVDILRNTGIIALGVALFFYTKQPFVLLISYGLIAYGVGHMLFTINLGKMGKRK